MSRQTLIREQMNTVVSEVHMDVALADLQNAYANVYASLGIDPVDASMSSSDPVDVLADKLRKLWAQRDDALASAREACVAPRQASRCARGRRVAAVAALALAAGSRRAAGCALAQRRSAVPSANASRAACCAPRSEAVLSSTLSERITAMPYREGDRFAKGAALVSFDCGRLAADLRAARAGEAAEARNAGVQAELLGMGATGKADADIAGAQAEGTRRAGADDPGTHERAAAWSRPSPAAWSRRWRARTRRRRPTRS